MVNLFDPIDLGEIALPNRVIMAPMTRARAGAERIPNDLMAEYYRQRATAGLIISEAVSVCPQGVGYANTPGLWSQEQVEGWRKVTRAVHDANGRIVLQLWHVGRISHPVFLQGELPVAPSAIAPLGNVSLIQPKIPYCQPRALGLGEIPAVVQAFQRGAENAQKAGFDGVEIHAANGYLIDQFLQDGSNHREDEYGGLIENRARLLLEIADAVISIWGAGRVGVHLAPRCDAHSMGDSNPKATFSYVVQELARRQIAFLCARESQEEPRLGPHLKALFKGAYIVNQGLSATSAQDLLSKGQADAAAFGKAYIANPDLVQRFYACAPLNKADPASFYLGGTKGYTDYPALEA